MYVLNSLDISSKFRNVAMLVVVDLQAISNTWRILIIQFCINIYICKYLEKIYV